MTPALVATDRVIPEADTSATIGRIVWDAPKSLWWLFHAACTVIAVGWFAVPSAVSAAIALTGLTILAGHSVGMHRLLIHRSFTSPLWLEHLLVWLGTLVGMAGPFGMIRAHDMRDWHQRQLLCPPHPSHGAGFWRDAWWQMHCRYQLDHPPRFIFEPRVAEDRFYQQVERFWMLQQIPVALVLWLCGGWSWVLWGISVRVIVSLTGHWAIGHYAHRRGHQGWSVDDLPVQGYNLRGLGLISFGENWHGNHHAFPHSAKLGLERGQLDPGYRFIQALERVGLARSVQLPESQPPRDGLRRVNPVPEATLPKSGRNQMERLRWTR